MNTFKKITFLLLLQGVAFVPSITVAKCGCNKGICKDALGDIGGNATNSTQLSEKSSETSSRPS